MSVGKKLQELDHNIYLVGFMGAGKSTVGKILAKKLRARFFDTDALIEMKLNKSISNIFAEKGEPCFREIEAEIVKEVASSNNAVIALGGGAVIRQENWERIKKSGITIYLKWDIKSLIPRIQGDTSRPLAQEKTGSPVNYEIEKLLLEREPFYEKADMILNCQHDLQPEQIADKIIHSLQEVR
ncbi:MAG: shikimate kinase [bacterium]